MEILQEKIGYRFQNPALLIEALTHPSVAHEAQKKVPHNQRLEFLGDAVLQLILTEYLFSFFNEATEGRLTKLRSLLANRNTLARLGVHLGLGGYLILGKGEENSGGRHRGSAIADAFEALIGAIYLDTGYPAARDFLLRVAAEEINKVLAMPQIENAKGRLQEILQAQSSTGPSYFLISETGPDHDKVFHMGVKWKDHPLGQGKGPSKKEAEMAAAADALEKHSTEDLVTLSQQKKKQTPPKQGS